MERLQKVLAQAGIASRRKCETLIVDGRVTVDDTVVTELGFRVNAQSQRIEVDGKPIHLEEKVCLVLHKPTSRITSVSDPEGRKTVMDLLSDVPERVYPVGRLDYDTSGLLLLTNDGTLTQRLLHPSFLTDKVYRVTVLGMVDKALIQVLQTGVELDDGMTAPARVQVLRQHPRESVVELTIHEGRNRQVRRMFEALDLPVKRLKRIQFANILLGTLATGSWRILTREEWRQLYEMADLPVPTYPERSSNSTNTAKRQSQARSPRPNGKLSHSKSKFDAQKNRERGRGR